MIQPIAGIVMLASPYDWHVLAIAVAIVAVSYAASYWRIFVQWLAGIRGRDWTTTSALIDVVSVVVQTRQGRYGEYVVGYLATLTYFYRNPELQTGDYSRIFDDEADARAWAASYKGCNVMVHVDPRDPSNSVLRKEEL
jgi:hypothetical protein